ncbi:replication initiation and membrane attachment family protein [Heyndrickxia acidicola]|uniref:Replication initiation and membrane attachment family protein n=1 Tax=Heyndrickxia acidicola TaxID=209389 RepID=A0ABU6MKJ8_9BACI|nr:replication initiation and membrane attachment family protein [Heyndrickxia acidicola]MED1204873.1 replication initiation and membrane attachment family protein [Heyndrickxia acidicola]
MNQLWNHMQPVDRYQVALNGILHDFDRKVLSLLYQPLIGAGCFSLYMTLWSEVEENRLSSEEWTHYHLMNFLSVNLREIYEYRIKLEGMGLLKSFVQKTGDERMFIYELQPPLSPEQFFTDGMLNVFLYRKLGKAHFSRLKKYFSDKSPITHEYQEITRTFQDVFASQAGGANILMDEEGQHESRVMSDHEYFTRKETSSIKIENTDFDFEILKAGLHEMILPQRALTAPVKEAILKLSFLYNINAVDMKNLLLTALNDEQEIDIEELRKAARDWYQIENANELPNLVDRIQPPVYRGSTEKVSTQEEKLIAYLETTSPRQLLIDISDGAEPSKGDLQALEEVMFQQQLSPGVTNVLIQYVMLKTDMKLSKNYLEKIASHWSRKKVKSVKEAMELAKNEHRQYQEWAENKKTQNNVRKQPIRKEKLPDWFVENDETENQSVQAKPDQESIEEKRKRLEELQKKFKK